MKDKYFLDTNVFVYSFDQQDNQKREISNELIKTALMNHSGCISSQVIQEFINVATKKTVEGKNISLFTPLLHLSKNEIIKKGFDIDVPFQYTWSCYQGKTLACGRCDSCLLRLKGFQEAGLNDPLTYESTPSWYTKK